MTNNLIDSDPPPPAPVRIGCDAACKFHNLACTTAVVAGLILVGLVASELTAWCMGSTLFAPVRTWGLFFITTLALMATVFYAATVIIATVGRSHLEASRARRSDIAQALHDDLPRALDKSLTPWTTAVGVHVEGALRSHLERKRSGEDEPYLRSVNPPR